MAGMLLLLCFPAKGSESATDANNQAPELSSPTSVHEAVEDGVEESDIDVDDDDVDDYPAQENDVTAPTANSSVQSEDSEHVVLDNPASKVVHYSASSVPNVSETVAGNALEPAPAYCRIVPVAGWSRHYGDSARSVSQWFRWWKYLHIKSPVLMHWIDGLVIRIHPNNEINRALFVRGIYDPNPLVVLGKLMPSSGGIFIDAGADNGYFSLLISRNVGNDGSVYALEPSSRGFGRLMDNIKLNHLENTIHAHRLAVSDKTGMAKLKIAGEERNALNTLGNEFGSKGIENAGIEDVPTVSIDEFVDYNRLPRVDCLKLDIEGSELKALIGAHRTIAKYHPAIMLGINENALKANESNRDELQRVITELGYVIYKLVESPKFALQLVDDFAKEKANVVFCLPQGMAPPALPQPEEKSFGSVVQEFFH